MLPSRTRSVSATDAAVTTTSLPSRRTAVALTTTTSRISTTLPALMSATPGDAASSVIVVPAPLIRLTARAPSRTTVVCGVSVIVGGISGLPTVSTPRSVDSREPPHAVPTRDDADGADRERVPRPHFFTVLAFTTSSVPPMPSIDLVMGVGETLHGGNPHGGTECAPGDVVGRSSH